MMDDNDGPVSRTGTSDFLRQHRAEIVAGAETALARLMVPHYESAENDEVRRRLETLFDRVLDSVARHDLGSVIAYAETVAEERFNGGYDLSEVQTAFNALEESVWTHAVAILESAQLAETLGLVSTTIGCGKDALARKYVSLATRTRAPSLDLRALFRGSEGT